MKTTPKKSTKTTNIKMKTILMTSFMVLFTSNVFAASGFVKGKVEFLTHNEMPNNPQWNTTFMVTLQGVTSAGSCIMHTNNIRFRGDSDQMSSIFLAAQMSGTEVAIAYDDTQLINDSCKVLSVTTGNPPPLM